MNDIDLLVSAFQTSPHNMALAQVLAPQLVRAGRWVDILTLLGPLTQHPEVPDSVVQALTQARTQLADLQAQASAPRVAAPLPVTSEPLEQLANFTPLAKVRNAVRFADVGGMEALKAVAQMKIVQPFANPALFKKYGQTAGGGILLYGPPGCGKTFFAKAIAGECDAAFFNVGIHDILNLYVGNSERNVQRLFATARAQRPAILFIDELDALGRKRDLMRHSSLTSTINAFLAELDGAVSDNDNLLVIGATNAPWDIDSAFKRPGRFDQLLFVPPPDAAARQAILDLHLAKRPCSGDVDAARLSQDTEQFSGADLAALVDAAASRVLTEVLGGGQERPINQADLLAARKPLKASTQEWLATARNYVEYANEGGDYSEVAQYLEGAGRSKRGRVGFF